MARPTAVGRDHRTVAPLITFRLFQSGYLAFALFGVSGLLVVVNVLSYQRLISATPIRQPTLFLQLCVDISALNAFFFLGGGDENPFTSLYLIHVALAAIILEPGWVLAVSSLVIGSYSAVHYAHYPLELQREGWDQAMIVPFGRIISYIATTGSIAAFVMAIASSQRHQERALHASRERTARTDRLRSVGTLAAGAAHELNTPLTTMGLRLGRVRRRHQDGDTQQDVEVMREQLARCTAVVQQLLVSAGDPSASDIMCFELAKTIEETINLWSKGKSVSVRLRDDANGALVELPKIAFCQGFINLLQNAHEAQVAVNSTKALEVMISQSDDEAIILLRDYGIELQRMKVR